MLYLETVGDYELSHRETYEPTVTNLDPSWKVQEFGPVGPFHLASWKWRLLSLCHHQ